ncbi:MAG: type VI secretion system membrane subunit TssM, partial [Deltaproteobacteria bacterium]|nr:type VI secretion system membrane subunit TssM [Deltaproteobacteria bacterium]
PGGLFGREFDLLVQEAHRFAVRRLSQERNRVARESIFQFPLELAGIKRNFQDLIAQVFMVNAFQGTPAFRGFYMSSGTQEGLPLNRVLQRMGQAMGIQPQQFAQQPQVESKSYFLHDVFTKVVFPDADVAARSQSEIRRARLVRVSVSAVALLLAVLLAVPSAVSFYLNQELLEDTKKRAKQASKIDWEDGKAVRPKLEELDPILKRLKELDEHDREGPPGSMRFMMYSGDRIYRPTIRVYVANMQQGFVKPCKYYLERQLKGIEGKHYVEERAALKMYLMLSDVANLDVEWATGKYTALWAELQKSTSDVGIDELKKTMRPHVQYYFELIKPEGDKKKPRATPVPANEKIVARARKVLQEVPVRQRYYALFVESVSHELYDPSRDKIRSNLQFPPVSLDTMFTDRPEVLKVVGSRQYKGKKKYLEVHGPYTEKGHFAVLANIKAATKLLEREQWVVPLTDEERGQRVMANVAKLKGDYEQKYIAAWTDFLADLQVQSPANLKEAIELYAALQKPEWPYLRVLRALEDHTQWGSSVTGGNEAANKIANQRINRALTSRAKGLRFGLDVNDLGKTIQRVPNAFKMTVGFGVPRDGGAKSPLNETPLAQYMELLGTLREKMVQALDDQPEASVNVVAMDLQKAVAQTEALLQPTDDAAKRSLLPLLQMPLNVGGRIRLNPKLALRP